LVSAIPWLFRFSNARCTVASERINASPALKAPVTHCIHTDTYAASATTDLGLQDPGSMGRRIDRERPLVTRAVAKRHPKRMLGCAANMHFALMIALLPMTFLLRSQQPF
jgi:hypothetical protein